VYPESLKKIGLDINQIIKKCPKDYTGQVDRARMWITILDADIRKSQNVVEIKSIKMGVKVKKQ
jgi:hypothetical protein